MWRLASMIRELQELRLESLDGIQSLSSSMCLSSLFACLASANRLSIGFGGSGADRPAILA